jgi:hypothetical protein
MRRIFKLLLGIVIVAAGAAFHHWVGWPLYQQARDSETWPQADGEIVSSRVESHFEKNKTKYSAKVDFTYVVDGQRYTSNWIWPSGTHTSDTRTSPSETVARYPAKKEVKVYYDPKKPEYGVLEPGLNAASYVAAGAGGAIMVAGLIFIVTTLVRR